MIPRSVCMLFLWVGVGLGTECPLAGGVACESNIGGFCNPTQRDCIRVREPALKQCTASSASPPTGPGTGTTYPCHVVPNASLAVLSRPVNLSVVRSPFQFVQRTGRYSVYAFDITVTWDNEHYYSGVNLTYYAVRVCLVEPGHEFGKHCRNSRKGHHRDQCVPATGDHERKVVFENIMVAGEGAIAKVWVANTPYDYQAPDCSDNSVIFNVESDREEELINPEHCGPPINDIIQPSAIDCQWIEGREKEHELQLTWPDSETRTYFVSLSEHSDTTPPDCRNQGNSLPCFVTNQTNVTIHGLNSTKSYRVNVDVFSDSCDALTSVQHYKGCGSCCEWKDILPYRTAVSIATSPSGVVLLPTTTESLSTVTSLQDIPQVSTYHLTLLTQPPAKLASTTFTRQLTSPCGRTSTTQMQPESPLPTASTPTSFPLSSTTEPGTTLLSSVSDVGQQLLTEGSSDGRTVLLTAVIVVAVFAVIVVSLLLLVFLVWAKKRRQSKVLPQTTFPSKEKGGPDLKQSWPRGLMPLQNSGEESVPEFASLQISPANAPTPRLPNSSSRGDSSVSLATSESDPPTSPDSWTLCNTPQPFTGENCHVLVIYSSRTPPDELQLIHYYLLQELSSYEGITVMSPDLDHCREGLSRWLEEQYHRAKVVLCVCNRQFQEEWDQLKGSGPVYDWSSVVSPFSQLVHGSLSSSSSSDFSSKFAIVLPHISDKEHIPTLYLRIRAPFLVNQADKIAQYVREIPPYTIGSS